MLSKWIDPVAQTSASHLTSPPANGEGRPPRRAAPWVEGAPWAASATNCVCGSPSTPATDKPSTDDGVQTPQEAKGMRVWGQSTFPQAATSRRNCVKVQAAADRRRLSRPPPRL